MDPSAALHTRKDLTTIITKSDKLIFDFDALFDVKTGDAAWRELKRDKFKSELASLRDHAFNGLAAALEKTHTVP